MPKYFITGVKKEEHIKFESLPNQLRHLKQHGFQNEEVRELLGALSEEACDQVFSTYTKK